MSKRLDEDVRTQLKKTNPNPSQIEQIVNDVESKKFPLSELEQFIKELKNLPKREFQPCAHYIEGLDILNIYLKDESMVYHYVNEHIGLYKNDAEEIIGISIEGLSEIMEREYGPHTAN